MLRKSSFDWTRAMSGRLGFLRSLQCVLAILAIICTRSANGQFRSTQWSADSGLPQNIVRGIVQTPDGYLWLATLNGVARFDGVHFTVYDKSNTPGISANRFAAIVKGEERDLWLLGENGVVTRYHNEEFRTLGDHEGLSGHAVNALTADQHGAVWILQNGKIYAWNNATNRFEQVPQFSGRRYNGLSWVGTGFWALEGQRLSWFVRGRTGECNLPPTFSAGSIRKVAVGWDGAVWFDLPDGRHGRWTEHGVEQSSTPTETVAQGLGVTSWKILIGEHLDRTLVYPSGGLERGITYNTIMQDSEGDVWVGSEGQGLFRIQRTAIRVFSKAEGLVGANVYPVLRSRGGDMWIGTWPAGLTDFHGQTHKTYGTHEGIPGLVTALAEDHHGDIWVGTHGGLVVLSKGKVRLPSGLPHDLPVIQAILEAPDGTLLLGTPDGVYKYDGHAGEWLRASDAHPIGDVRVIVETRNGDIWFGGYGGLTRWHDGNMTRWLEHDGLPSNSVRCIYEDHEGVLWIGTYDGGLGRFADGRWTVFNKRNGLFDNGVFQILEDTHSHLWMSSNRGIYRVSKRQLNEVASGRLSTVVAASYGKSDGMLNVECNGGLWPAGATDPGGKLWFPTQEGVAIVDPEQATINRAPPRVLIESVSLDHTPLDHLPAGRDGRVVIRPGQQSLELQYTALNFSRPDQLTFRYRMDGLDNRWDEAGYRRTAYYSHLAPGKYLFRVMAANSDGVWSETDATLPISVLPPFYRAPWFIALTYAILLLSAWALWSYRERHLKGIQAAQQAFSQQLIASQEGERSRISAELHDSLGQRLIIIKNLSAFLLRPRGRGQSEQEQRETISEISSEASLAIEETRAISYGLRPFHLDRLGLTKAIEALARSATHGSEIQFKTQLDDIDESFRQDIRINFYRIVQEGINNVLKHSEATEAEILVERAPHAITLSIRDNGRGLPAEQRTGITGQGGFGLTGMKERAASLNGTIRVQGGQGGGTQLIAEFHV